MSLGGFNEAAPVASALSGRAHDLVKIAAYIYIADQAVSRGGNRDAHHEAWRRDMTLCAPVSDPHFWSQDSVATALEAAIRFATQDMWSFRFSRATKREPDQLPLFPEQGADLRPARQPDHVLLLSGGADSVCAGVQSVTHGRRPYLVSHRPSPLHDSRQGQISDFVGHRFGVWPLSRTRFPIHRIGWQAKDSSQRSRAFLFASLGASMASEVGVKEVVLQTTGSSAADCPSTRASPDR
jgi:hypothetical protein